MKEPVRFRDDPCAPAGLRADLRRAAEARAPVDVEAGLARLLAATAVTAAVAEAGKAAGGSAAAGGKGLALVMGKGLSWGLAAVGTAGVLAAVTLAGAPRLPEASCPYSSSAPALAKATPPSAPPEPVRSAALLEPAPSAAAPQPPVSGSAARPQRRLLAEEVKHYGDLRERLDAAPADVLAEAERGARAFPGGALAQEREVLAIEALVRLGRREEARGRAAGFAARYPKSPLVPKVWALVSE